MLETNLLNGTQSLVNKLEQKHTVPKVDCHVQHAYSEYSAAVLVTQRALWCDGPYSWFEYAISVFARSPCSCVGFLWIITLSLTVQKHNYQLDW